MPYFEVKLRTTEDIMDFGLPFSKRNEKKNCCNAFCETREQLFFFLGGGGRAANTKHQQERFLSKNV